MMCLWVRREQPRRQMSKQPPVRVSAGIYLLSNTLLVRSVTQDEARHEI